MIRHIFSLMFLILSVITISKLHQVSQAETELVAGMKQLCVENTALEKKIESHGFSTIWEGMKEVSIDTINMFKKESNDE